jgi:DNA-binding NtrC family response regulator
MEISIPPLRHRKSDIRLLVERILEDLTHDLGKHVAGVSEGAMQLLFQYNYPGNVRELKNILENAVALCSGDILHHDDFPQILSEGEYHPNSISTDSPASSYHLKPLAVSERATILEFLNQCQWDMRETAKLLHIDRSTLWRKMKKYNLSSALEE